MWKNIAPTKTWPQEESRELSIVSPKLGARQYANPAGSFMVLFFGFPPERGQAI